MLKATVKTKKKSYPKNKRDLSLFDKQALKAPLVRAGFPESKVGGVKYKSGITVIEVAAIHNVRWPFLKIAAISNKAKYGNVLLKIARQSIRGRKLVELTEKLGKQQVDDIRATILSLKSPPLAASTVKAKNSNKILIGKEKKLFRSVSFELVTGKRGKPKRG